MDELVKKMVKCEKVLAYISPIQSSYFQNFEYRLSQKFIAPNCRDGLFPFRIFYIYGKMSDHEMIMIIGVLLSVLSSLALALFASASSYQIPSVVAQTVPSGECNCILDSTSYASTAAPNLTGLTIPSVDLLKNESVISATEGSLTWITEKGTELLGVLSEDYFLGNFSRGTGKTVALNMLDIQRNESLGIGVSGGSIPDQINAEIIPASVNKNGTLAEIITVGPKIWEIPILYDEALEEPAINKNILQINVPNAGDYLLLVELSYDNKNQTSSLPLTLVYETVLVVE